MAIKTGEDTEPLADPEDKRSFFDRLKSDVSRITAGNIDDPKSEAYKKYGAGANQLTPRKVSIGDAEYEDNRLKKRAMERSRVMQQDISAGTDFIDRPQDEGYRPYISPRDRAVAEGEKDAGKIIENTGPRKKPVAEKPRIVSKKELEDSGFDNLRDYLNDQKGLRRKPSDKHAEARKNLSSGKKNIDEGGKPYRSGGSVSSASKRADGIAQRGKTRGRMY
jgi:hypothetical protein